MLTHEIALLIAVATPVVVVAAIDIYLALSGETETLLLPRILAYPVVRLDADPQPQASTECAEAEAEAPMRKAA